MGKFNTEQNFRLMQAIDWIDTFAEELFDIDDSTTPETGLDEDDSRVNSKRPPRKRRVGSSHG